MVIVSYPRLLVMNLTSNQRSAVVRMELPSGVSHSYSEGASVCALRRGQATELNCCVAAVGASVSSASP